MHHKAILLLNKNPLKIKDDINFMIHFKYLFIVAVSSYIDCLLLQINILIFDLILKVTILLTDYYKFLDMAHARQARSHEDSRKVVCCVCGKKPKGYAKVKAISVVNEKQIEMVKSLVHQDLDVGNPWHPTGMCLSCNTTLSAFQKVKK